MIVPAIIAGASALGAAALSAYGGERANKRTQQMAREQMDFQRHMSNTAWQRGVKDMRMAGLNPLLAFDKGPASAPAGAMSKFEDVVTPALNSAMAVLRMRKELQLMDATKLSTLSDVVLKAQEQQRRSFRSGGSSFPYWVEQERYKVELMRLQKQLLRAGMDAAQIRGTKLGGILQLIFGGSGLLSPIPVWR